MSEFYYCKQSDDFDLYEVSNEFEKGQQSRFYNDSINKWSEWRFDLYDFKKDYDYKHLNKQQVDELILNIKMKQHINQ